MDRGARDGDQSRVSLGAKRPPNFLSKPHDPLTPTFKGKGDEMTMIPKCTSWLGHRFEGRFSSKVPDNWGGSSFDGTASGYAKMADAVRENTYECDVCVRCGHVVRPSPPPNPTSKEE